MMTPSQLAECAATLTAEGFVKGGDSWSRLKSPAHAREHVFIGPGGWDYATCRSYTVGRKPFTLKQLLINQRNWEPAPWRQGAQPIGAFSI